MKKIFLIFITLFFMNISVGWGAFFYADTIERVIQEYMPEEYWDAAAAEYMEYIDPETGEIDTNGFLNFCYAGGFDVATEYGAKMCKEILEAASNDCPYYNNWLKVYNDEDEIVSNDRRYLDFYDNPISGVEKVRKCINDKSIDWAIDNREGELNESPYDRGNCVWKDGKILTDEKGNRLLIGATKWGITTCASKLEPHCIRALTRDMAKKYYWTRHYMTYRYYTLPIELQAQILEMSISGQGNAAKMFQCVLGGKPTKSEWGGYYSMMTKVAIDVLKEFINGIDTNSSAWDEYKVGLMTKMNPRMTKARSKLDLFNYNYAWCVPDSLYGPNRRKAYRALREIYIECADEYGVSLKELGVNIEPDGNSLESEKQSNGIFKTLLFH